VSEEFRHRTPIQVRFRDIDAFGHVNNAVFFSYVELARIRYLIDVLQPAEAFERLPLILARVELDYRSPILLGEDVTVETEVVAIGGASFTMHHRMTATARDGTERAAADVTSVLVTYDYAAGRSIRVPDEWRSRMADHEGRTLDRAEPPAAVSAGAPT
jgi:acyl-CoA thioester hydrolase